MKKSSVIALWALLMIALPTQAVRHYKCDFETEAARNRWTLNPTANQSIYNQLKNKWYIGEPGNNDSHGHYGLFISDDNGQTAHYSNKGCFVFAYDTVSLDHLASGDYTIYFDWCAMANITSDFDGLYLFWIPDSVAVMSSPNGGSLPKGMDNYIIPLQPLANMDYLNGTATWQQCAATIPNSDCDGTPHYLAFAWTNGSRPAQQPGAMVDNIFITDNKPCDAPDSLVVKPNGTTVTLTWKGTTATEYEVSAYSYDGQVWAGPKIVNTTTTSFTGLPIGQTDFIVRAKCDEDFFSLKTIESKLIYYPDQLCVDYLNLDSAKCYVANSQPKNTGTFNDWKLVAKAVDHGPTSSSSRHTVHFDRTELDSRTANGAKTIPDGELASVRLGNWEHKSNEGAEQIEFSFPVDTIKHPVLLLKYMPVIEAPNHDDYENSRFTLDILVDGVSIGRCGRADFNANDAYNTTTHELLPGAAEQGWHLVPPGYVEGATTPVVWKEWTTVGVNLKKYVGKGRTITARLATYDCIYNAHFGYAYFTLGCSDGKLKGMKCGQINPTFEAPDGFEYRWAIADNEKYRLADGSLPEKYVVGRGQTFDAGMQDDNLYVVDCMFVGDSTCYFSLYASTLATNPISKMRKPLIIKNCQEEKYTVKFDASPSWVQEIDHVTGDTLISRKYRIETYEWNIEGLPYGWSDEVAPTFEFPITGGDYDVSLRTTCGTCDSTIHYHLHLDPLGPTREIRTITLCDEDRKNGFVWNERSDTVYYTYCTDSVNLFNEQSRCDSVIILNLVEPERVLADTMLLPESLPFTFHGRTYPEGTKSLVDTIPFSATNCEQTWVLNLEIYESLIASMPNSNYILCEGDPTLTLVYDIARGRSLRYKYTFDNSDIPSSDFVHGQQPKGQYQIDIPIAPTVEPNTFTGSLLLVDSLPEFNVTIPFSLSLRYNSEVITQRWNDVLAIRNDSTIKNILGKNGYDYNFNAVQWYLDGAPIEGANDFVYYTGEDQQLQMGAEYSALLTRNDGAQLFTCVFTPAPVPEAAQPMPQLESLVAPSAPMHVPGRGTAYWYDMLGRRHHTDQYNDSYITAPGTTGYYLLVLRAADTTTATPYRVLVR